MRDLNWLFVRSAGHEHLRNDAEAKSKPPHETLRETLASGRPRRGFRSAGLREIVFDTETTGLDANRDRIIEIGAVELVDRLPTGLEFHQYLNPQGRRREVISRHEKKHGLSSSFLADKPTFDAIAAEFVAFVGGAKLIAHNAAFDIGFLNAEFARLGQPGIDAKRAICTLEIARNRYPTTTRNTLDALCDQFGVDRQHRSRHGALVDSKLLAEVYVRLVSAGAI